METQTMKKGKQKGSIATRIIALTVICILVMVLMIVVFIIPRAKNELRKSISNNMLDLATMSSKLVDVQADKYGVDDVSYQQLGEVLADVGIEGLDSSYAYVVDESGTFIYHKRQEKVGTEVFNVIIQDLLSDLKSGTYKDQDVASYTDENGVVKYASYQVSKSTGLITVIVADESEALAPINTLQNVSLIIIIACAIILLLLSISVALSIKKSVKIITNVIADTGELDFSSTGSLGQIINRTDEVGEMARATKHMHENLKEFVVSMRDISFKLDENANSLIRVTSSISQVSEDNSATTQELAASMEETAATVENIEANTVMIKNNSEEISAKAANSVEKAKEIGIRAEELQKNTNLSNDETRRIYEEVKDRTELALEKAKSVEKINALVAVIDNIADQTSLLALNASIEAARAGESGKGFAVVAGEIGHLAAQSTETAADIVKIVEEVNDVFGEMSGCVETICDFIEENVMKDYRDFIDASRQYDVDTNEISHSMEEISEMIRDLLKSTEDISTSLSGISITVSEAAEGVSDIAGKTNDIVGLSTDVSSVVEDTSQSAKNLDDIASKFVMEEN